MLAAAAMNYTRNGGEIKKKLIMKKSNRGRNSIFFLSLNLAMTIQLSKNSRYLCHNSIVLSIL